MATRKKKMTDVSQEETKAEEIAASVDNTKKSTIVFSFRVSEQFKDDFQVWCVRKKRTQSQALEDAFVLLKREYGEAE